MFGGLQLSAQLIPNSLSNLSLWLKSDIGVTLNGSTVSSWNDQSGNGFNAIQNTVANQPLFISTDNNLNSYPSLKFDGVNDLLTGVPIPNLNTSSMTVFVVGKGDTQNSTNAAFFSVNSFFAGFWLTRRAATSKIGVYNNGNLLTGVSSSLNSTGFNYKLFSYNKNFGVSSTLKLNGIVEGTSTNSVAVNGFTNANYIIGSGTGSTGVNYAGSIAEVIVYNRTLSISEQDGVEKYLMDKYATPINLGVDINNIYGFCDITLSHQTGYYTNYSWNTGATTSSINVNNPGTYWVAATDVFGRVSRDTIVVNRPHYANVSISNQLVCYNNLTAVTASIPVGDYTFVQWSDGNPNQTRQYTQGGTISYIVRDNQNCTLNSNTATITFDNSLQNVSLGNDTSLCEGNSLQLVQSSPSITNYLWSSGSTASAIPINLAGEYHLTVTNGNGCSKKDTIQISIQGQSPTILLNIPSQFCQNESASFSETSFVLNGEAIGSRFWNFGNGSNSSQSSGDFTNTVAGTYNGFLIVTSAGGCQSSQSFTYSVRPKPVANYSSPLLCDNVSGQFINTSIAPSSTIFSSAWLVDDVFNANTSNFSYAHPTLGTFNLKLVVTNSFGCRDSSSQTQQVINTYPIPNAPYLVDPFNGKTVLSIEQVPFIWSSVENNYFYELQFSNSSNFSPISNTISTVQNNYTWTPNTVGTIYWRVKANNPCLLGGTSPVFSINSIQIADSLRLWLRADNGVILNGSTVNSWLDGSSNGLNAIQNTVANQPLFMSSNPTLNQKPSIKFDGVNDVLTGGLIPRYNTNSLSVFVIGSGGNQSTTNAVMFSSGASTTGWWFTRRASAGRIGVINNNNSLVGATTTLPTTGYDFKLFGYNKLFSTSAQIKVNGFNEISSTNTTAIGGFTNANYQVGAGNSTNYLNGEIAEIMAFTKTLTAQEQTNVEKYLMDKYAPPVNLGEDINNAYGFCDVTLQSTGYFTHYLWSNGATTSTINVNTPGSYWVRGTDVFGRLSYDTIVVNRPHYSSVSLSNQIVCYNDIPNVTASLPSGDYSFIQWSDGNTSQTRQYTQAGTLSYSLRDNQNCTLATNAATITFDNSLESVNFGNDAALCQGNILELVNTSLTITSYSWNTGSTSSSIAIDTSGLYILTVTNSNGCSKTDSVQIAIQGQTPTISLNFPSQACQGSDIPFSQNSTVPAPNSIDSIHWTFDNQPDFTTSNGSIVYSNSGTYNGSLEVITLQGCRSIQYFNFVVSPLPNLEIQTSYACSPNTLSLSASNYFSIPLSTFHWTIEQNTVLSTNDSSIALYAYNGNLPIQIDLVATDSYGCQDSTNKTIEIQAENTIQLTYPADNLSLLSSENISFSWTDLPADNISTNYIIQIASDLQFNNVIEEQNVNTSFINSIFSSLSGSYFWRVKRCYSNNWSNIRKFNVVNIPNGLKLWLRSDSLQIASGKVAQWYDRSGNGNHCSQSSVGSRPVVASSSPFLAKQAVKFDGVDDFLSGSNIAGIHNSSITSFIVCNGYSQTDNGGLLTIGTLNQGFGLYRGTYYQRFTMLNNYGSNSLVFDMPDPMPNSGFPFKVCAMTKNFGEKAQLHSNGISGTFNSIPSLVGAFTNANYQISGGDLGKLNGEIAEVILFDQALSTAQRNSIESYLMDRYAPPVNLGADINSTYGFCDLTLQPTNRIYTSYLWSNAATTDSISINQPGTYWVQTVDVFGRTSTDTIRVFRPVFNQITLQDEAVCFGQSETYSAPIPSGNYSFLLWSDGVTNPSRQISSTQSLSYSIQDSSGCQKSSNIGEITIDSSLINISLGPDTTLCEGNPIALESTPIFSVSYYWNTGNTNSSQTADTSGNYILNLVNINGCANSDSIFVNIVGVAPTIAFNFPNQACQGSEIDFSQNSFVPAPNAIDSIHWTFDNQPDFGSSNGSIVYSNSGNYNGSIEVTTLQGCRSIQHFSFIIHDKPNVSFNSENYCPNEEIIFHPSNQTSTPISIYHWNFGQGTEISSTSNPGHIFGVNGIYSVTLDVEDVNGCKDTTRQNVEILPKPIASFNYVNSCEKNQAQLINTSSISDTFSITTDYWNYGDGTESTNPINSKIYSEYGIYEVELVVLANNGCSDTLKQTINIQPNPILNWKIGPACKNTWTTFENLSTVPLGSISQTDWLVNLQNTQHGTASAYQFVTTGIQYLNLTSITDQGCSIDTLIIVNVQPEINANYKIEPSNVVAGIPITFSNISSGGNEYFWDFGLNNYIQTTDTNKIEITPYSEIEIGQTITTSLAIKNSIGCSDTATKTILVNEPRFDLELKSLFAEDINGYYTVGVEIKNNGLIEIQNTDLLMSLLNTPPVMETYIGSILPGESHIYIFSSKPSAFISNQDNNQSYICIEGNGFNNYNLIDQNLLNNRVCKNTEDKSMIVLPVFPNPTSDLIHVNLIISDISAIVTTQLLDNTGRLISENSNNFEQGFNSLGVTLSEYKNGIYYLKVSDGTTSKVVKLLKN